eukprot:GGOE01005361.1.p4 GENE.GGOE01005361.1~~GGOE01005361.1.p4  ORF type:complete len:103 (-),score=5.76 GGOE01005361.1:586-894(-)
MAFNAENENEVDTDENTNSTELRSIRLRPMEDSCKPTSNPVPIAPASLYDNVWTVVMGYLHPHDYQASSADACSAHLSSPWPPRWTPSAARTMPNGCPSGWA